MSKVKDTLHFHVEWFSGHEEGNEDLGYPYYVASCEEIVAVTEAQTWPELLRNIREMVDGLLEGEDTQNQYQLTAHPRIMLTMELPDHHAEIA